jgi:cell division protein FtsW
LALVAGMSILILKQPNLSVTMIIGIMTFLMLIVAGLPRYLCYALLPPLSFVLYHEITHNEYQMKRITGWWNPWKDPLETGYNLIQSYYAIGSGGLFGVGLGNSIQKLYYLPFQHTDFIFSVICEEWGFIGASIVIGLFGLLAWRGFAIAWHCPSRFGRMLAFGLTLAIVLQAMINISVTVGLMPVTGVTLPLISYGGTSMIVTLGMIGMLLNISRYSAMGRRPQAAY